MEVYIFRNKFMCRGTIYVSTSKPHRNASGNYNMANVIILFSYSVVTFRKKFGFTIRPGRCMKTDLELEMYGVYV